MMMKITQSDTTKNVLAGGVSGTITAMTAIRVARNAIPQYIPWGEEEDNNVAFLLTVFLTPLFSRWLAFARDPKKSVRHYTSLVILFAVSLAFTGCATNTLEVMEQTEDGYTFSMTQKTSTSVFAKQGEGQGDVKYSAPPNGDSPGFDFRAGSSVKEQEGGDPIRAITGLIEALGGLAGPVEVAK